MNLKKQPLYVQIYQYLKEKIIRGEWEPHMQLPTELELAEQFEVSRITSKRALMELENENLIYRRQGSGSFVKEMGQNQQLENRNQGEKIISMILPFDGSAGLMGYVHGAIEYTTAKGYTLQIHTTKESPDVERSLLIEIPQKGVQGIIIYPKEDNKNLDILYDLYLEEYPIIAIDKYFDSVPLCSIYSDNFEGGYLGTEYLIQKGHEKIAFVSSITIENTSSLRNRYFGYCKALKDYQIHLDKEMAIFKPEQNNGKMDYEKIIKTLLTQGATAIQAENDYVAVDLLKACLELGVAVPEQVSIIGFDNLEFTAYVEVPLTTIEQNFFGFGQKAAQRLITWIETGKSPKVKEVLPVNLIERQSVFDLKKTP